MFLLSINNDFDSPGSEIRLRARQCIWLFVIATPPRLSKSVCISLIWFCLLCISPFVQAVSLPQPNPPTGLAVTAASGTSISLSWTVPADDSNGAIEGYNIYRCDQSSDADCNNFRWIVWTTSTTYTDDGSADPDDNSMPIGMTTGATYRYAVSAYRWDTDDNDEDDNGASDWSNIVTQTAQTPPVSLPKPPAPTLEVTAASDTSISLSWTVTDDGNGAIEGYNIYRCDQSSDADCNNFRWIVWTTSTTYTDDGSADPDDNSMPIGMTTGATYRYAVSAYRWDTDDNDEDDNGDSDWSNTVTQTAQTTGTLTLNLDAIAGDNTVNIAEKAAGFAISGDTGSVSGASVTVTVGTTELPATTDSDGDWSVSVPAAATYITGASVAVTVSATKTGLNAPSNVGRILTIDLTAPTAPSYSAPSSLTVGTAITNISPSGGSGIDSYAATGLPSGLTISTTSGVISGTPDTANASSAGTTVTVSDTAGNTATASITFPAVDRGDQTLSGFKYSASSVTFGGTAPTGAETTVTYSASPAGVCTVSSSTGVLALVGAGSCVITATAASSNNYNQAMASFTVTVVQGYDTTTTPPGDDTGTPVTPADDTEESEIIIRPGETLEIEVTTIINGEESIKTVSIQTDPDVPQGVFFDMPPLATTAIAAIEIEAASADAVLPPPPAGNVLALETILDITLFDDEGEELSQLSEPFTVCLPVSAIPDDVDVTTLEVYHLRADEDQWTPLETFYKPGFVCGKTSQFSLFAVFYPSNEPALTPPGAPQQLAAQGSNEKVALSWLAPPDTGSSALQRYTLYRGDGDACDNLSALPLEVAADSTNAEDENVTPGVTYCYRLTASNNAGEGTLSTETVLTATTVGAPTGLIVTDSRSDSISLKWSAPATDGGGPLDGYNVYRCAGENCVLDEDSWLAWVTGATTYTDDGSGARPLTVDTDYRYAVAASRAEGVGAWSNQVMFTIIGPNSPPIADAGPDQTVDEGTQVRLDGSRSEDPDNRPGDLVYTWEQVKGQPVTLNDAASATPGFSAPSGLRQDEQLVFMLMVTDGSLTAEDSIVVTVVVDKVAARQKTIELSIVAFGRTVAAETVDVFSGRFAAPAPPERNQVTLGGKQLNLGASSSLSGALTQVVEWLGLPAPVVDSGRSASTGDVGNASMAAWEIADNHVVGASWQGLQGDGSAGSPIGSLPRSGGLGLQTISLRELLSESAFQMALGQRDASGKSDWTLWGRGSLNGFEGRHEDGFVLEGDVFSGYLGLDFHWQRNILLGIAVSHSQGDMDYTNSLAGEGELETTLTSVYNYLHWSPRAGLNLWGTLGYGWGDAELTDREIRGENTDLTMWLSALGIRNELATMGNIDVAIKADVFGTWLETDEKESLLAKTQADSSRLRLMLEGSTDWTLTTHSRLTPSLELGVRWDGGDAETGLGMELGGGISYTNTRLRLSVDTRGRYLLVHEDSGYEEWGASLTARAGSDPDGEGLSLSLAPTWGQAASGIDRLWGGGQARRLGGFVPADPTNSPWLPQRLNLKLGYGLGTVLGVLAPFAELSMAETDMRRLRLGTRLATRNGWEWRLLGERLSEQDNETDYLIGLFANYRFNLFGSQGL